MTAPNEAFVVISRSVRGRVEVQGIVDGIIEPLTERNVIKQEGSTVSLPTSSPVSVERRSREAEEEDDVSKPDCNTRSSYDGSNTDIIRPKPLAVTGGSNTASLTTKRLEKRRHTVVEKGIRPVDTDARNKKSVGNTNAGNKETVVESSVEVQQSHVKLPTLPSAASNHSNVDDMSNKCSTNTPKLPRISTLLSVAQKVLTVRKRSRAVTNVTRAFEFSYFDRIIRS